MKLIIHIGTHKTGTTAIQRAFSANREKLLQHGVWYPNYFEVIGGEKSSYAHLDIAKGIMNERCLLSRDDSLKFLQGLHQNAKRVNANKVLLSAESFLRGREGNDKKIWQKIQNFQLLLKDSLSDFTDIQIVVTFRSYVDYLESLFNEHVKATNYEKDIFTFHEEYAERFNYKAIVSSWEKIFGEVKVISFQDLDKNFLERSWTELVFDSEVAKIIEGTSSLANPSWPLPLVDLKRKFNKISSKREAQKMRVVIENFTNNSDLSSMWPKKYSWLNSTDRENIQLLYKDDSDWLASRYDITKEYLLSFSGKENTNFLGLSEQEVLILVSKFLGVK